MNNRVKKISVSGMFCALAYVFVLIGRIPISSVDFLKYDPKDIIIAICGFILGPLSALAVSVVTSLIEMVTISTTGIVGLLMNIISTASFACTASFIYKKRRTLGTAVLGLIAGALLMTVLMLLWNYIITPVYMGYPREAIADMLLPVFLPFNLIKSGINASLTFLLYKPVVTAMRKAHLVEDTPQDRDNINCGRDKNAANGIAKDKKINLPLIFVSLIILAVCVISVLFIKGII